MLEEYSVDINVNLILTMMNIIHYSAMQWQKNACDTFIIKIELT